MQDYLLEVRNLSKYYAGVKALDNVSMGFRKGEVHALAGENGAGKSTLIKMLTGAIEPTHGEIILEENHIRNLIRSARLKRAYPQCIRNSTWCLIYLLRKMCFLEKSVKKGFLWTAKA